MELEQLKEALGDKYDGLKSYVDDLVAQRDAARKESIDGRKALKARVSELEAAQARMFEKLGIESLEDIDQLPDAKGQAEAAKQYEAKVKQMTKQLADLQTANGELTGKLRDTTLSVQLEKALNAHDWLDRDTASLLLKSSVEYDGDNALFKTSDGKLISLDEGAKAIAQTKQYLLKSQGTGGSGYTGAGSDGKRSNQSPAPKRADFASDAEYFSAAARHAARVDE